VPDEPSQPKDRVLLDVHIPRAWIFGVLAALAVLVVVAVVAFSAVNRVDTCGTCHQIKPEVTTYKASAHYRAGVGCQKCHTKPGAFNYFIRNLQGATNLILHVSNQYERPITTFVGADTCTQCHTNEDLEKDIVSGNIRVNHTGLRQAGYQCLTCHATVAHPGIRLEVARVSQNKMSICARCHDGVQLSEACDLCHISGVPADASKVAMTVQIGARQCAGCHRKSFCGECHNGLTMPHPGDWPSSHGGVVNDRGRKICVSCHLKDDKKFCIDCHGVAMPHPDGWRSGHSARGQKDPAVCVKCHGKNSCIRCHGLAMPHPGGWTASHPSTARTSSSLCSRCHSSSFCTNCHGVSLPHSGGFIANHPQYAYSNGGACVKCHGNSGSAPGGCYGGECHSGSID